MERRMEILELTNVTTQERLTRMETKLESIATKADLHEHLHSLTWRMLGSCALLVGAVFSVVKLMP